MDDEEVCYGIKQVVKKSEQWGKKKHQRIALGPEYSATEEKVYQEGGRRNGQIKDYPKIQEVGNEFIC